MSWFMIHPIPFCLPLCCDYLIEITLYKHYATVRKKIQFPPAKYSHPIMFFIVQKRTWCQHRRLCKIPCFQGKLLFFPFCDAQNDVWCAFLMSAKNPRTAGDLRKCQPIWWLAFTCNHFSHLAKSSLADTCSKHLLFTFSQNRGKFAPNCLALQLLHLLRKAAHRGKQGAKKGEPFGSPILCFAYSVVPD